jgi:cysteine desulfurase / selenocysteine lyase
MVYLDNAATSYPKAPGVAQAVLDCLEHAAGGPGRTYGASGAAQARLIYEARRSLAELLGIPDPTNLILTPGGTFSLNLALRGLIRPGAHVVTTALEHNAVARPLTHLGGCGVTVTRVPCPGGAAPEPEGFRRALRPDTALIAAVHGSNVAGTILPIADIARIAREAEVPLLVDASQTVGSVPVSVSAEGPHLLAFTGHKGLLGPPGTGGLYIDPGVCPAPLTRGGTGSRSYSTDQPAERPDCYESGTPNVPGLAGLGVAAHYLLAQGVAGIREHEVGLIGHLMTELRRLPGVTLYGPRDGRDRCGLVAFNVGAFDPAEVGERLERDHGIATRCGLHCAPWAHESLGTLERGAVRMSVSPFTTHEEIETAVRAVGEIVG